jgi:hypothetical protein
MDPMKINLGKVITVAMMIIVSASLALVHLVELVTKEL